MIPDRFRPLGEIDDLPDAVAALVRDGYYILRGAVQSESIERTSRDLDIRFEATPFSVGPFHGHRTKRFHRLLARSRGASELVMHPVILEAAKTILGLWCDFPEINLTQGVEVHPAAPAQIPHSDQNMWPLPKGSMEFCVNVFWPFGDFTPDNGATRVWPGSHYRPRDPQVPLSDPLICEMKPGDALLVLGSTVHAAGANRTSCPRRAAIVSYCLGWLKSYENQSLAYSPQFVRTLEPELAALLGYRWHRPNLGTYDGQCPSILLEREVPDHLATIDALSPEHEAMLAAFTVKELSGAQSGAYQ
jgi:hypothetical protein